MKFKNSPKKALVAVFSGILILAVAQVIGHYFLLPDFVSGFFIGLSLTLILTALVMLPLKTIR